MLGGEQGGAEAKSKVVSKVELLVIEVELAVIKVELEAIEVELETNGKARAHDEAKNATPVTKMNIWDSWILSKMIEGGILIDMNGMLFLKVAASQKIAVNSSVLCIARSPRLAKN